MSEFGGLLENVGAICILWAGLWLLWDKYAFIQILTLESIGFVSLVIGGALA